MNKIKILVVEDEIIIADNICETLSNLGYNALEPAISFTQALETLEQEKPDIAILDIQLSGKKDGVDLAWEIKEKYDIPFVFLTSNSDTHTIERVKKLDPPAFLVKPFNKEELFASIEIALHNFVKTDSQEVLEDNLIIKDSIFIKTKAAFEKIRFDEIVYLKSDHVYIELFTKSERVFVVRASMTSFIEKLPANFFRTHRSYIVNLNYLDFFSSSTVKIGDNEIPIGKVYRDELLKKIKIG